MRNMMLQEGGLLYHLAKVGDHGMGCSASEPATAPYELKAMLMWSNQ